MFRRGVRCVVTLAIAVLAIAAVSWAGVPGTDLWVPSLARVHGAHGSQWYATVWIHNPGTQEAQVRVSFLARNQSNPTPIQQTVVVNAGETLKLGDVFQDLFGLSDAKGALHFQSDRKVVVSARSYNLTEAGVADSQGQFLAGMPSELALAAGEKTSIPGITQPADGSFRCNYALVETAGGTANVQVTLYDADGVEQAQKQYTLAPYEPVQFNLSDMGSGLTVDGGRMDVEVLSGDGKVLTFASMVGNGTVSQDPSTLEMEYELQQGSGGTGLTQVAHDATLAGDGTSSSPLGIADGGVTSSKLANGAVTTAKISGSGASNGQVLKFNGSSVTWGDVNSGGFTLPYVGSLTNSSPGFKVVNSSGVGLQGESHDSNGVLGKSSSNVGVLGESDTGYGVHGTSTTATGVGVVGEAPGAGVIGNATATTGSSWGVMGTSQSPMGAGVVGVNHAEGASAGVMGEAQGMGVVGFADDSTERTYGVYASAKSTSGIGVYGDAPATTGQTSGVFGAAASNSGTGVHGRATASSGYTYGVYGESASDSGTGVYGESPAKGVEGVSPFIGVLGVASRDTGTTYGVEGKASSPSGSAVYGDNAASSGSAHGVYGVSSSPSGVGVEGVASASTGTNYGVRGITNSSGGYGVYGSSSGGTGVYGYSTGSGTGLKGISGSGFGVYGSTNGDWNWFSGVYGKASQDHANGVTGWNTAAGPGVYAVSEGGTALIAKGNGTVLMAVYEKSTDNRRFRVDKDGQVYADGSFHSGGADFAEMYPAKGELAPGTVVGIGPDGRVVKASSRRPTAVMGVVPLKSTIVGNSPCELAARDRMVPVAILGIVDVQASAASGPIRPGDLLCAGSEPGTAEKAVWAYPGTIIGKALEALPSGTGKIRMLVTLR